MPSRAEQALRGERVLRVVACAALALLVWLAFRAPATAGRANVSGPRLSETLRGWTEAPLAESLLVTLDGPATPASRDWLRALRRAGTAVSWSGVIAPVAAAAEWSAGPAPLLHVRAAGPAEARLSLADSLGELVAAPVTAGGAAFTLPASGSGAVVTSGATSAVLVPPPPPLVRAVVVLAHAGWESKFVVAALEERGWPVETRLRLAPGLYVTQGRPWPLDTARHAAVIVMDSLPANEAAAVAAYARRGGGVVLVAEAATALRGIAPGAITGRQRAATVAVGAGRPRDALSFSRLEPVADAVVLERRGAQVAAAARRAGAGRVVQLGYEDTWRWRFTGDEAAPEAHRDYWNAVVGAAAYRPADRLAPTAAAADPAPLTSTVFALGSPVTSDARTPAPRRRPLTSLLFAVLLASLLAEWASRRLRGAT
jgi:hypothetical protein